jgi:hypothetical protein
MDESKEGQLVTNYDENEIKPLETKIKIWEHIPVRPQTFSEFRRLKNTRSDDAFVLELLKAYKIQVMKNTGEQA